MEQEHHLLKCDSSKYLVTTSKWKPIQKTWIPNERHIEMANLPDFLQKPGSYESRLFDVTKHCLGFLCSFDMPPTSYTEYMLLHMQQCIMFKGRVELQGEIPFFQDSSTFPQGQSIHHYLLISQEKSLEPNAAEKDKKKFFLQLVSLLANCSLHHFKATIFNQSIICVNVELCLFRWKNIYKKYNM